jgi:hypothetical protein
MVDAEEFGSGGKGEYLEASDMDFAATTTGLLLVHSLMESEGCCDAYPRSHPLLGR